MTLSTAVLQTTSTPLPTLVHFVTSMCIHGCEYPLALYPLVWYSLLLHPPMYVSTSVCIHWCEYPLVCAPSIRVSTGVCVYPRVCLTASVCIHRCMYVYQSVYTPVCVSTAVCIHQCVCHSICSQQCEHVQWSECLIL